MSVLIAFIFAVRILAGPTYVQSAIEVAEQYSGVCLAMDPECSVGPGKRVNLGHNPTSQIQLGHHLLGTVDPAADAQLGLVSTSTGVANHGAELPQWVFCTSIFHPPKA